MDGHPTGPASLRKGDVIVGKYEILDVLGEGGMGSVFEAWHRGLGKVVAIKVLLPSKASEEALIRRFEREALAGARLRSPGVIQFHDVDKTEAGLPYLVMERLYGHTLEQEISTQGRIPYARAADYLIEIADTLETVHASGVIHRDVKPSNIFLHIDKGAAPESSERDSRRIKLIDFGASKIVEPQSDTEDESKRSDKGSREHLDITRTSGTIPPGSPLYMPPEAFTGAAAASRASDIWAFGVLACELLTGKCPFQGDTFSDLAVSIVSSPPCIDETLLGPLKSIILKCLEKDPEARYANMAEVRVALLKSAQHDNDTAQKHPALTNAVKPERKRVLTVGIMLGTLFAGAGVFIVLGRSQAVPDQAVVDESQEADVGQREVVGDNKAVIPEDAGGTLEDRATDAKTSLPNVSSAGDGEQRSARSTGMRRLTSPRMRSKNSAKKSKNDNPVFLPLR
jgi:serine/threonine protein kinase